MPRTQDRRAVARALPSAPVALLSILSVLAAWLAVGPLAGADDLAPHNGPRPIDPRWHALTGATVVTSPGEVVENATVVIRNGVIESVRSGARAPRGARVWDLTGHMIYPGLIDAYVPVEAPAMEPEEVGAHWYPRVQAQRTASEGEGLNETAREQMRSMGFTTVQLAPDTGVFRGMTSVVSLGEPSDETSVEGAHVLADHVHHVLAFETGGFSDPAAPSSQMGAIALIRQTLSDADWHAASRAAFEANRTSHEPPAPNFAWESLDRDAHPGAALLFDVDDELEALRATRIGREFNRQVALVGSGTEFRRMDPLMDDGAPIIVPLEFPEAPDVDSVAKQESTTLRELMTWEQAPANAARLIEAGLTVAITTSKIDKRGDFMKRLRQAMEYGLTEEAALAALTTTPAAIVGMSDRLGQVAPGMLGNLVITDGPLFDEGTTILDVWVAGRRHMVTQANPEWIAGEWSYQTPDGGSGTMDVEVSDSGKVSVSVTTSDEHTIKARNVALEGTRLSLTLDLPDQGAAVSSAVVSGDEMFGTVLLPDGMSHGWSASRLTGETESEDDASMDEEKEDPLAGAPVEWGLPFGAFAHDAMPGQERVAVVNATIWTAGPAGVIEDGTLLVDGGEIVFVGPGSRAPSLRGARIINARGKHISPGLIDCHSHTGISGGVNEVAETITAEVRIQDVINPDDVNWYRQLAGGLTAANQLHGSANPIGGQNSVVKLRWGVERPEDMLVEDAMEGIKFALGENPKRVSSGPFGNNRYPESRMGVEAIIRERFTAARDYADHWSRWESTPASRRSAMMPPRRDLELEALAEILANERLIHCHSYRQDEILMLCRIAQRFGFTIGTFQHVLEGYKVADAIKEAALGASSFSDWWAFKFEVYDAIPYNGAIMENVGVVVSFNSDSAELARRMNTEATKAVKYGGVEPHEALKFVTLNPAIQLAIEDRTGSLEVGKDADFVIWSAPPLSTFARCESTWVDGREMFSLERDLAMRDIAQAERARIIQKILAKGAPKGGDRPMGEEARGQEVVDTQPTGARPERGSMFQEMYLRALEQHKLDLMRAGLDPNVGQCGDCGCDLGGANLVLR